MSETLSRDTDSISANDAWIAEQLASESVDRKENPAQFQEVYHQILGEIALSNRAKEIEADWDYHTKDQPSLFN